MIRLIGVKSIPEKSAEAVEFLNEKTKGSRVYLRFDARIHDEDQSLMCYLYLENKTFLNAHLIKNGLAEVDSGYEFRYKSKFLAAGIGN